MKGVHDFMFCENVCGENIQEGGRGLAQIECTVINICNY